MRSAKSSADAGRGRPSLSPSPRWQPSVKRVPWKPPFLLLRCSQGGPMLPLPRLENPIPSASHGSGGECREREALMPRQRRPSWWQCQCGSRSWPGAAPPSCDACDRYRWSFFGSPSGPTGTSGSWPQGSRTTRRLAGRSKGRPRALSVHARKGDPGDGDIAESLYSLFFCLWNERLLQRRQMPCDLVCRLPNEVVPFDILTVRCHEESVIRSAISPSTVAPARKLQSALPPASGMCPPSHLSGG